MTALARIDDLHISFGGVAAANGVSFAVNEAEFLAVIGPNGAGKTTALRMVAGILRPDSGRVFFDGRDVTGLAAHARVRLGLGFTHQIVRPFYSFTTIENVMLAAGHERTASPWRALTRPFAHCGAGQGSGDPRPHRAGRRDGQVAARTAARSAQAARGGARDRA